MMKDVGVGYSTRLVPVDYMVITAPGVSGEFRVSSVYEVLYSLRDTDGPFTATLIDDDGLTQMLEKIGVAFRCARGGYRRGKNYESFCDMIGFNF